MLDVVRQGVEIQLPVILDEWPAGENPFVNGQDFDPRTRDGQPAPRYPLVPQIPGFSFPNLYPESDQKLGD